MAGFRYGLSLGFAMAILRVACGDAVAWLIFWLATAMQLGVGASLVWRRTRLPRMTGAFGLGAAQSAMFAMLAARGVQFRDLLFDHPVLVTTLLCVPAVLLFSERWFSKEKWDTCKHYAERATVGDLLTYRHIPNLRVHDAPR
jgi:hypothetical protein